MKLVKNHPNTVDSEQVEKLTSLGATQSFIASHLGIDESTLLKHYSTELNHGSEQANLRVAETFYRMATSGEFPQMTLLWMKMRAHWQEPKDPSTPSQTQEELEELHEQAKEKLLTLLNRANTHAQSK